jgi:hypothetical protein
MDDDRALRAPLAPPFLVTDAARTHDVPGLYLIVLAKYTSSDVLLNLNYIQNLPQPRHLNPWPRAQ